MRLPRRQFLHLASAAVVVHAAPEFASAQSYPDRPVRMIVPYAPGGPTDVITRLLAQKLAEQLGKQFFVENVGGGGGNIGMGRAAKAAPDGYTLLVVNPSYVINPTSTTRSPMNSKRTSIRSRSQWPRLWCSRSTRPFRRERSTSWLR